MATLAKLIPLLILLSACTQGPYVPGLTPYKMEIRQGNYVTQDMVAKLKPGMSKSQVRFALGTPLIVDPFHPDRWDYVYALHKKGRLVESRRIVAVFKGDALARIEGDVVPSGTEKRAGADAPESSAAPGAPPTAVDSAPVPAR